MATAGKPAHFWSERETVFMLDLMREMGIVRYLDGRKNRNGRIFKRVSEKMADGGFSRTVEQVRCRWKSLKQAYLKAKNHSSNTAGGRHPPRSPHFDILEGMLGRRPPSSTAPGGVDVGFENRAATSMAEDGESSSSASERSAMDPDEVLEAIAEPEWASTPMAAVPSSLAPGPTRRSRTDSAMASWSTQQQVFIERMQQQQNTWLAQQIQQSQEREERLISSILEASTRSTERLVTALLEGLRNVRSPNGQVSGE